MSQLTITDSSNIGGLSNFQKNEDKTIFFANDHEILNPRGSSWYHDRDAFSNFVLPDSQIQFQVTSDGKQFLLDRCYVLLRTDSHFEAFIYAAERIATDPTDYTTMDSHLALYTRHFTYPFLKELYPLQAPKLHAKVKDITHTLFAVDDLLTLIYEYALDLLPTLNSLQETLQKALDADNTSSSDDALFALKDIDKIQWV